MTEYKEELIKALKSIDGIYFQRNERDFSYEFYHQLRCIKLDIDITSETPKYTYRIKEKLIKNSFFIKYFFRNENSNAPLYTYNRRPDLLFHEYENKNRQILACEIKPLSKNNELICKDISKLLYYTNSDLSYKYGVLILFTQNDNDRKLNQLKNKYQKVLIEFPQIEIWIAYPNRIHIIWAEGSTCNEIC
ncbi:MAG: hypothetical protein EBX50_12430 [Chitinophagia bacterium]|nr:hypothetical protein [Chitinophagia bacterium]